MGIESTYINYHNKDFVGLIANFLHSCTLSAKIKTKTKNMK